ncbi:MAG: hypothetical protein L0H38_00540 [bacterium]|nr:hypothetical protein [bacterium]
MKILYGGLLLVGSVCLATALAPIAKAHVLIVDSTDSKGAILHINPNDNPVAGQKAALIFDTDKDVLAKNSRVVVDIKSDEIAVSDRVEAEVEGPLAVAEYTFPSRGVYKLAFQVMSGDETMTFNYTQRVSRGIDTGAAAQPDYEWAKILLLGGGIAMATLFIIAFNNRHQIRQQSSF